jgi:hypothetical protein
MCHVLGTTRDDDDGSVVAILCTHIAGVYLFLFGNGGVDRRSLLLSTYLFRNITAVALSLARIY